LHLASRRQVRPHRPHGGRWHSLRRGRTPAGGGRVGRARSAGGTTVIKPEDLTAELIAGYFGTHCECRPLDIERTSHSHDCDDDSCEDARVALSGRPDGCGYRSTVEALIHTRAAKRRICDDILDGGGDPTHLTTLGKQ